jgi:hypothetical protein
MDAGGRATQDAKAERVSFSAVIRPESMVKLQVIHIAKQGIPNSREGAKPRSVKSRSTTSTVIRNVDFGKSLYGLNPLFVSSCISASLLTAVFYKQ